MKIGIVGSGNMGAAVGTLWAKKGHHVMFSYSKNQEKLNHLSQLNKFTSAGSVDDAILHGDVIMLAVPYASLNEILLKKQLFKQKIVITCVSGLQPDFSGETIGLFSKLTISVAEHINNILKTAKVIEAFNTTFAEILQMPSREVNGQRPSLFYCGDNIEAKKVAAALIEDCDYIAVNAGGLLTARAMETLATSWVQFAVIAGLFPRIGLHALHY